jgi:isoleucyl-tRNA synthetase
MLWMKLMHSLGLIYRQFKPVYWSPSSRTALAEAELEYDENHKSLAAFVRFPVTFSNDFEEDTLFSNYEQLNIVIWTTTPWTLPANNVIAVHNDLEYVIVIDPENGNELVLVAASRVDHYQQMLGHEVLVILKGIKGSGLAGRLKYENPFQKARGLQPVVHANFVSDASGTGFVHMAAGHGMDDYNVCSSLGIQAFAPVDDAGAFTKDAFPEQPELLEGLLVSDEKKTGSNAVINYLKQNDLLRAKHNYKHKYPIDWRTKQPVIVRATEQWFANVDDIKNGSMKAIEGVKFLPETGRSRLESFVQGRSQWCISRQRAWGVPIPALYKLVDGKLEAAMDSETIQHVIDVIKERGIDAWWTDPQDEPAWKPKHLSGDYVRGKDTMDVWFDSGSSWTLLPQNKDQPVADVYLEGTDQHRGWFQSSLLTHVATQSYDTDAVKAPYKTLITHGFTLDSEGRKMSKSLGNVISPMQIMSGELLPPIKRKKQKGEKKEPATAPTYDAMGSDALRLWAASSDYMRDVTIGQPVLLSVNQALHKYRVTFKWLLGIFASESCPPHFTSFNTVRAELSSDYANIPALADKFAIHRLIQVSQEVRSHYTKYEFFKGVNSINRYIATDLSAFYFETIKDRVYTGSQADCINLQNVLAVIFYELLHMLAPVCPLLVEEVWDHVPEALKKNSVHPARAPWTPLQHADLKTDDSSLDGYGPCFPVELLPFNQEHLAKEIVPFQLDAYLNFYTTISTAIKAAQERMRAAKNMGSSLECSVHIYIDRPIDLDPQYTLLDLFLEGAVDGSPAKQAKRTEELCNLFVVSSFDCTTTNILDWACEEKPLTTSRTLDFDREAAGWYAEEPFSIGDEDWEHSEKIQGCVVVSQPRDAKCKRCWRFMAKEEEELCARCTDVITEEGLEGREKVVEG